MPDPDLEIRGRPSHPDPYMKGRGGGGPPQIFSVLNSVLRLGSCVGKTAEV